MRNTRNIQGFELLRINHAGAMQLTDGRTVNYGVIRINDQEVVYYTGKGLREMWKPKMTQEEKQVANELRRIGEEEGGERRLIQSQHIAITNLDEIVRVIF